MFHTVQQGRMFCAPRVWPDLGGPTVLRTMQILTLVLCSCSGKAAALPWNLPSNSSREYQADRVFIHTESSQYSLPCSPIDMKVADPTYQWVQDKAAPKLLSVTKEGHLLFQHFQAGDSGKYSCTISYKKHGVPVSQTFHYSVFGYHVPGGLDIVLLFHSTLCEDKWTKKFLWDLQEKLRQLEIEQHCKVQLAATCFPSLNNPSDEFIIQVRLEVSLFGPQWDEPCNSQNMEKAIDCYHKTVQHNLGQVQLALNRFFKEHKSFHITRNDTPSINFTNEFVGFLKTEQCSEGYGQTRELQRCLNCCIACPPGTFSPPRASQCSPCPVGTYSLIYGVAFCTPCKDSMITMVPGASSIMDCGKKDRNQQVDSIVHRIPLLILIIVPAILALNFLFIPSSCYWFCREYRVLSRDPAPGNMVISFFRISRQHLQNGPAAGPAILLQLTKLSFVMKQVMRHSFGISKLKAGAKASDGTAGFQSLQSRDSEDLE
ncbi:PREDICTED: zona pellucida-binding protein 2-like [Calidris pugnax]|uniref:zona pellucida-binding protein 2-like n=1 Tax=Calidris pugnax TaxID=198806 RepID=UPI00071C3031|nr:PREDICTED: zona pellucida-binding protein 2-like [Calidris pugnax]